MEKLNEDYTTVVVQKGGKLEFDISAPEVGSILRWISYDKHVRGEGRKSFFFLTHILIFSWEFRSEGHDIKFGILKKDISNGTKTEVIPIRRVASHQSDEIGLLTCETPTTCKSISLENKITTTLPKFYLFQIPLFSTIPTVY